MRILADMHISPVTDNFLRSLGHDAVRVNEMLPPSASDREIVDAAKSSDRAILTHSDLLHFHSTLMPSGKETLLKIRIILKYGRF